MSNYKVAETYVQKGYSVIPLIEGDKRPFMKWLEYNDRKPTQTELMAMFSSAQRNVGIVTGPVSKLLAVDIDNPALYDSFMAKYPTGKVARTPSGGYHLLYSYDGTDIGNSVSRLASGIDVRCKHGYIVAAPSRIKMAEGGVGAYTWLKDGEPDALPGGLHDLIIAEMPHNIQKATGDDGHNLWAHVLEHGFTAHSHNEQVRDLARYLTRMGLNETAIHTSLAALNSTDDTPLASGELRATTLSGINYELGRIKAKAETKAAPVFTAKSLVDVITDNEEYAQEWLIDGWLPARAVMVVTAPPENYKTWLAFEAAVAVALGQHSRFLNGFETNREPQHVLIVQQEDFIAKTAERLRTIMWSLSEDLRYNFYSQKEPDGSTTYSFDTAWNAPLHLHTDSMLSFDDDSSLAGLEAVIKEHSIKLVVIDPLYSMGAADDYFAALARKMILIKKLRDKYGTTFLFVHHNKKGTKNGKAADVKEREGMWGSQLLNGAFEGLWLINMAEGQRLITRTGKAFNDKQDTFAIKFDINTVLAHVNDSGAVEGEKPHYRTHLTIPVNVEMSDNEVTLMHIITLLGEATHSQLVQESNLPKPAITRAIKNLLALKSIEVTPETRTRRNKVYKAVEEH